MTTIELTRGFVTVIDDGVFEIIEEAAMAYAESAKEYFGEFAKIE